MKEFVISEAKAETAVLVGLITPQQDERKTAEYLDELAFLAETAGAVVVKRFTQRAGGPSSLTYVGSGKLEEIAEYIREEEDNDRTVVALAVEEEKALWACVDLVKHSLKWTVASFFTASLS